jgi:hypothetical protein
MAANEQQRLVGGFGTERGGSAFVLLPVWWSFRPSMGTNRECRAAGGTVLARLHGRAGFAVPAGDRAVCACIFTLHGVSPTGFPGRGKTGLGDGGGADVWGVHFHVAWGLVGRGQDRDGGWVGLTGGCAVGVRSRADEGCADDSERIFTLHGVSPGVPGRDGPRGYRAEADGGSGRANLPGDDSGVGRPVAGGGSR